MDLVSAIIPFYKKTKYIHETVSSILKQTYADSLVRIGQCDTLIGWFKL